MVLYPDLEPYRGGWHSAAKVSQSATSAHLRVIVEQHPGLDAQRATHLMPERFDAVVAHRDIPFTRGVSLTCTSAAVNADPNRDGRAATVVA